MQCYISLLPLPAPQVSSSIFFCLLTTLVATGCRRSDLPEREPASVETAGSHANTTNNLDFNRNIAPIVYTHCTPCHRSGESAPFSLISYQDVTARALQIANVVERRYMPPWLPEEIPGNFANERRLTTKEIKTIVDWAKGQQQEGKPDDLPTPPTFAEGWQLGKPDLIVEMPEPYILPADGPDVFRNFVLPVPIAKEQFVQAVEIRPGNRRIVHHGFLRLDRTPSSRDLDDEDAQPGFDGMQDKTATESPDGHFLSWTPGKTPHPGKEGYAWHLPSDADLVLFLHLLPTGKLESIQPRIGLHFASGPPTHIPFVVRIGRKDIDIPAGESTYVTEDQYTLPVKVKVLSVYPHAHYLGKWMRAWAKLPDGTHKQLIEIPDWDFNWQEEYQYRTPIVLPAGTVLHMRYVYDNSSDNKRNPHIPPRRVIYGSLSSDEMGDLWFQVETTNATDRALLAADYRVFAARARLTRFEFRAAALPEESRTQIDLGSLLASRGDMERARQFFQRAVELSPDNVEALNQLGGALARQDQLDEALVHFRRANELQPDDPGVHNNLGTLMRLQGHLSQSEQHYQQAIQSQPQHALAHKNLGILYEQTAELGKATHHFQQAIRFRPQDPETLTRLANVLMRQRKWARAETYLRRALRLPHTDPTIHRQLGRVLAAQDEFEAAVAAFQTALQFNEMDVETHEILAKVYLLCGNQRSAVTHFSQAVKYDAGRLSALNSLAWIFATSPENSLRNDKLAVRYAEQCAESTEYKAPEMLDTLAAAYAEAGRFDDAVRWQTRAIEMAPDTDKNNYRSRLKHYQSNKAFHGL